MGGWTLVSVFGAARPNFNNQRYGISTDEFQDSLPVMVTQTGLPNREKFRSSQHFILDAMQ
jgi:hypothetical protein